MKTWGLGGGKMPGPDVLISASLAPGSAIECHARHARRVRSSERRLGTGNGGQCLPKRNRVEEGLGVYGEQECKWAQGVIPVRSGSCELVEHPKTDHLLEGSDLSVLQRLATPW